jgi:hypothetical protein
VGFLGFTRPAPLPLKPVSSTNNQPQITTIMAKEKEEAAAAALVTVRANEPIREGGEFYDKGKEFETTPERAKALGSIVEIVG